MDNEFKTRVAVELDTTKAEQQLKELGNKKVKLDVDTGNTEQNINKVDKSINVAQKSANSFGSTLKKSLDIGIAAAITAKSFQVINNAIRDANEGIKDFDESIKDLRIATGESYESVQKLVKVYNEMGKELGATTREITNGADSWLRQGHSIAATNTLVRDSTILAKVAKLEDAEATQYLTSTMKGYKIEAEGAIGIVDKLTAVDLVSATDAGGLAEAMSRTAVTADMAGISMDRLLGYIAVTGEVTQKSMSTIGESYKTILTRMSDIKADKLELVDEDGTTELLSDVELTLKNVGIDLRKTVNEYNNYGDVLDNLAAKWSSLSQVQQNALAKAFAGTRQAENFRVLMENYDTALKYMDVAANSAGTAEQKFNAYLDSIEAKTKSLQAAFESLAVNSFSTEMYGGIIEATTAVIEFLDKTNLLKGSLAGLAAAGAIKLFVSLATGISNAAVKLNEFNAALKMVKAGNIGENEIAQLAKMTANLSQSQLKAVLSSKALTNEQRLAILTAQGMSQAEAQAALASMGLATAEGTATTATFSLSGALKGLWATLMANPLILVVAAITAVVSVISSYNQAVEEARQKAIDAAQTAMGVSSEISELVINYNELSEAVKTDDTVTDEFISTQDELIEKLGLTKSEIQGLIDEYGNLSDAIKNASIDKLQELERDIRGGLNAYEDELLKAGKSDWGIDSKSISGSKTNGLFSTDAKTRAEQKRAYNALKALEDAGLISSGSYSSYTDDDGSKYSQGFATFIGLNDDEDLSTVEGIINAYERLGNMLDIVSDAAGSDNFVYETLYKTYNGLTDAVNNYHDAIGSLNTNLAEQYALQSLMGKDIPKTQAEFDDYRQGVIDSAKASGEFVGSQEDIEAAIDGVLSKQSQFADFYGNYTDILDDTETAFSNIVKRVEDVTEAYDTLQEGISAVQSALAAQSTGESLSVEDFNSEELRDYISALEYHNGVLQLNAEKVSEIVEAKTAEAIATNDANKAMAQSKYLDNAAQIEKLRKKLKDKNYEEGESAETIQANIDALLDENGLLKTQCDTYDLMSASLREATDAYHNWLNAQNAAESGDMFDDTLGAINHIIDTLNDAESDLYGRVGRQDYKAAVGLIVPDSVDPEDADKVNKYLDSIYDLFTYDDNGNRAGLNIENFCQKAVDAGLMVIDEASDSYQIAGQKTMEDFAEGLNLSLPLVQAMFGEMEEFGGVFSWADEANKTIGDLAVSANVAAENLRTLNQDMTINLDVSDLSTAKEKAAALDSTIQQMQEHKGKVGIDSSEIEYVNSIISYCVTQKQQLENPAILEIDTSKVVEISETAASAVSLLQEFKTEYNNLQLQQSLGLDTTEAQAKVDSLLQQISSSDNDYIVNLALDSSSAETLNSAITSLSVEDVKVGFNIDDTELVSYQPEDKKATVTYDIDTSAVDAYKPQNLSRTVTYYVRTVGSVNANVNGTAHAAGTAMAGGNWGTAPGGKTLTGELGREIVVDPHTGRWYTVGDTGAEFVNIPRGAIVFNHKQTESLLANGHVAGRASALVGGTAMVTGGIGRGNASTSTTSGGNSTSNYGNSKSSSSSSSSKSSSSSTKEDEPKAFDWIEIAIDRIERAINRLKTTATSTYKALKTKLGATYDEITKVNQELATQQKAYDRYLQEANSVGLSSSLAEKVRNGTIDINEYDSETRELIESYQEWYEKALDCSDAIQKLHENLASMYEDNFNNIQNDYNNQLALMEHLTRTYSTGIDTLEAKGYLASTKYYTALQDVEKQNIAILNKELADLTKAFSEAMNSGEIEKYSDAWYDFQESINGVKEAIDEANLSLAQYAKTMREIEWGHFDYLQERISQLTQEADFLIDLMSNKNLYQDNGQFSDEGLATMGLHAQSYNVYMAQADQYADEILAINKELANDPYNTDLIERREELLRLQQESILAAEAEKDAIVEMVREGIEIELAALKELIDVYTDALDSAKDLYDYQRKIEEKSADIASLQKQLATYENDTSEETRAKIQQIKVDLADAQKDLAETEYEKFISDTKKLLDNLYNEYESILNERLDNVDALLADMIDMVNANATTISDTLNGNTSSIIETLERVTSDVGYTMTQSMKDIWNSTGALGNVVSMYGDNFSSKLTTINTVLSQIQANTAAMVKASEVMAQSTVSSTTTTTEPSKSSSSSSSSTPSMSSSTTTKTITVGGKINAGSAKIYSYAGDTNGQHQYFASDPIYTVLKEQNGYVQVRWHKLSSGITGWFKKSDVKAYKTGGLVDYTGLAQLDGTPGKPELVLNAQDTDNFLHLRDVLREMSQQELTMAGQPLNVSTYGVDISPQLRSVTDVSRILSELQNNPVSQNVEYTFGDTNINIDHVQDYNDFVRQLQNDKKFDDMIVGMTIGRINGGSSLAKYKYKFGK